METTLSVRISERVDQEIKEFTEEEKLEQTSEAVRKILVLGLETWHKERALQLLEQGKVTFLKAATIAKMDVWNFWNLVKERKIVWVKPDLKEVEEEIKEALQ